MTQTVPEQRFRVLFGIERQRLGPGLVISPFLNSRQAGRHMSSPRFFSGMAFSGVCGKISGKPISFICSGMGHPLTADCVLAQDAQRVNTIVFVGAVGAWRQRAIGDCVVISRALFDTQYYRQFPGCALNAGGLAEFVPDASLVLFSENAAQLRDIALSRIAIASVNSLWQQDEEMVPRLEAGGVSGIDLECALFYAAAAHCAISAVSLAVVTDIPGERPYWGGFSLTERRAVSRNIHCLLQLSLHIAVTAV